MRLIDADKAKKALTGWDTDPTDEEIERTIDELPTIEAAPVVHGRWIDMQEDDATEGMWRCSSCGSDRYFDIMTPAECGCYYCPNCGARMDGTEVL